MSTAMLTAHRTTGTVPAQFHFDITRDATIPKNTGLDFHKIKYEWNFGDGSAETFATSGLSSNTATGPVATHVYRAAGSYTVTLTVIVCSTVGITPTVYKFTQNVEATAFSGTTYYLSAAGSDSNDGLSTGAPFLTFAFARTTLFASNGPRRLLLNKGDTFAMTTAISPSTTGLFYIGAYGSGANPIIDNNNAGGAAQSGIVTPPSDTAFEMIVEGIDIVNDANIGLRGGHNCLFIDCNTSLGTHGIMVSSVGSGRNYCTAWNCTFSDASDYGIYFNYGAYCAVIGCTFDTITGGSGVGEHMIRCYWTHSSLCHNLFTGTMLSAKHALKFVGYYPTGHASRDGGEATEMVEYCSIHDNTFEGTLACNWQAVYGPIDATGNSDQRHQYLVVERNWHELQNSGSQVGIFIGCNYNGVFNNIFTCTGAGAPATATGVRVSVRGAEPVPTDNVVANNTGWRSDAAAMRTAQVVTGSVTTYCYNNAAQSSTGADALNDAGTGTVNSGDVQGTNLGFTDAAGGNFLPAGGSSLIAAGTVVPYVYRDYASARRDRTTNDTGARTTTTMAEPSETQLSSGGDSGASVASVVARSRRVRR